MLRNMDCGPVVYIFWTGVASKMENSFETTRSDSKLWHAGLQPRRKQFRGILVAHRAQAWKSVNYIKLQYYTEILLSSALRENKVRNEQPWVLSGKLPYWVTAASAADTGQVR